MLLSQCAHNDLLYKRALLCDYKILVMHIYYLQLKIKMFMIEKYFSISLLHKCITYKQRVLKCNKI